MAEVNEQIKGPGEEDLPTEEAAAQEQRKQAIALRYDVDKDKAPLVIASGRGAVADEILRIAEDNRIPLYEDPELAQLLTKLELDTEIPPELYTLVAEVLFFVYKLDRMTEKREQMVERLREDKKQEKRP
ncbi:MAG: EscU/YscU/HrcU family type III secretion system export apparatus switch protein [Candidatus Saganbacteria bacterium]|nr:EscU/YscU/HrcU family type III secretion system export apparatus switch protein [Candidatus Saganbacteria bacterium]